MQSANIFNNSGPTMVVPDEMRSLLSHNLEPTVAASSATPSLATTTMTANNNNIGGDERIVNEIIVNRYQPNHTFLQQQFIYNKTPLCLVNEICRSHNLKAEFVVLNSTGPEHSKTFSVLLKLGEFERFVGENSSIKSAQRTAAILALQNTRLKFPIPKPNITPRAFYHGVHHHANPTQRHIYANQTPASELNTLLMKKGLQPTYNVISEKLNVSKNNSNNQSNFMQNGQNNNNSNNHNFLHQSMKPPHLPGNNFRHHLGQNKQNSPFFQGLGTSRQASSNLFSNQPSSIFQNCDSQSQHHHHHQQQQQQFFNRNGNSFYHRPSAPPQHNYESKENHNNNNNNFFHHQLSNVMNSDVVNVGPNLSLHFNHSNINNRDGKVNRWNNNMDSKLPALDFPNQICQFVAYVEFDGHKFCGKGKTSQFARHEAARQGLKFLKNLELEEKAAKSTGEVKEDKVSEEPQPTAPDSTKTAVSLIYEVASQNRFKITFDLCGQSGQAHIPSFEIQCLLFLNDNDKEPFLQSKAEDRTKKGAKKKAAQLMLDQIILKKEEGCEHFVKKSLKNGANSYEENDNNDNQSTTANNKNYHYKRNFRQNRTKKLTSLDKNKPASQDNNNEDSSSNLPDASANNNKASNGNENKPWNYPKGRFEYNKTNNNKSSVSKPPSMTDSTTSRAITFLYQITRNLNIPTPVYHSTVVDAANSSLITPFAELFPTSKDLKMHQVECTLFLDQTLPQTISCKVKSIGYGTDPKMAKNISTHICLFKLGFKSPEEKFPEDFLKSLKFSLTANQSNSNDQSILTDNLDELLNSNNLEDKLDLDHEGTPGGGAVVPSSSVDPNLTAEQLIAISCNIKQNCRFVLYLLRKIYWPFFKSSKKNIENLFEKIESSFAAFFNGGSDSITSAEGSKDEPLIKSKLNTIKSLMQNLDGDRYWHHLELLSSLISVDSNEEEKQSTNLFLKFKCHNLSIESKPLIDTISGKSASPENPTKTVTHYVAIVSANCDKLLSSTAINFNLIKNNFVNFGLGSSSEKAQEVASCWALRNMAYIAMKQRIENDFESNSNGQLQPPKNSQSTGLGAEKSDPSSTSNNNADSNLTSKSKLAASGGQLKSKNCLSVLFDICRQLMIHKPVLNCLPTESLTVPTTTATDGQPNGDDSKTDTPKTERLFHVECVVSFLQEAPQLLASSIVFHGYGNTKRLARTISAYFALIMLGVPPISELLEIENFDKYFKYSLEKNAIVGLNLVSLNIKLEPVIVAVEPNEHLDEIKRNYDFIVRILLEIYKPFLKNHKMKDSISPLMYKIGNELFEYHNHLQQIMDNSTSFDKCSQSIKNSLANLIQSIDGGKFWHHLQLLSSIVSTLTTDLDNPITPPVLEFKCHFMQSTKSEKSLSLSEQVENVQETMVVSIKEETTVSGETAPAPSAPVPDPSTIVHIAIIKLTCHLPSIDHLGLTRKTFLSHAMGECEDLAREAASYKALRYLAVNFSK